MAIDKNKAIANAQRFTQKGQLDRALKEYQAIVAEDPEDVRIWLKIGDLFTKKGTVPQAVSTYARVAVYYSERGFFLKAVAVWKQILNIDPTYFEAHLKLAELYVQLGLAPDAIGQYQLVVGSYEREGRHRDSVALLKKIVELAPEDIPNRIRLAEAFARQNENPKAVEEFKVVLDQLHQRERWDEAIQVGERVAYLAPDDIDNLRLVSEVYLRRGDARRALARLQACFKAAPTDVPTLEMLARAFSELGQTPKAISVHRELARLHEEAENPAARLESFRRILALDPTDVEAISVTAGGRSRDAKASLPQQVIFSQGMGNTQGMQRLGAAPQPVETLSPEEQVRRHLTDIDLLLKYGLGEHALQTTDKILAIEIDHEGALIKRKDIAIAIGRRDEAIASILRLASIAEKRSSEAAMTWLGEALQISPHHNEANQRMQRLSSGMAAGLRRNAATGSQVAIVEVAAADDYPDLDLGALDFGDDGGLDAGASVEGSALGMDFDGDELPPPRRAALPDPPVDSGDDDFGGLNDVGDDEFLDLLSAEYSEPGVAPPSSESSASSPAAEDDFGGLLDDDGPFASQEMPTPSPASPAREAEDDFGGLLVGPRPSRPALPLPPAPVRQPLPSHLPTPARGISVVPGIVGAPTPQPVAEDFGDLGPMDLPDDDFSDLLSDEIPARDLDDGGLDFGELLGELPTPRPISPVETPAMAGPPSAGAVADDIDFGSLLPDALEDPQSEAEPGVDDVDTSFNLGDLLPSDLAGALAEAETADSFARSQADTPGPTELSPVDLPTAGDDHGAFTWDNDDDASFDGPAPTMAVPLDSPNPAGADDALDSSAELDLDDEPLDRDPVGGAAESAPELNVPGSDEADVGPLAGPEASAEADASADGSPDFDIDFDAVADAEGDASLEQAPEGLWDESPDASAEGVAEAGPDAPDDTNDHTSRLAPLAASDATNLFDIPGLDALDDDQEGGGFDLDMVAAKPGPETEAGEPSSESSRSEVNQAFAELFGDVGSPAVGPVASEAVSDAFGELSDDEDDYEDPDRTVFAPPQALTSFATATPKARVLPAPAAPLPAVFSTPPPRPLPTPPTNVARVPSAASPSPVAAQVRDEGRFDVEMEVASLPGVDLGLSNEGGEPIDELDDIELLDDDLDIMEDDLDGPSDDDFATDGAIDFDAPVPARRPMLDSRTVVAAVTYPDIEEELAEVDFLIESSLGSDARDALGDLANEHGIGHPSIQARLARLNELDAIARDAERAVSFIGGTEPTPTAPLTASGVDDLSEHADVAAHFDLGVAYMEMGQYKKAIAQLQKVANHRERRAEALRVIALCEIQQGNPQAAVKSLEDALAVPGVPRDGRVGLLYDLATAYEGIGNRIAARTQLKGIIDLGAGDFLDVRERLARLTAG